MNRERLDSVQDVQDTTSKATNSSPLWSPVLTRRRLSVPEIIMRKHALTQQRSRSDSNSDNESISALLPLEKKPSPSPRSNRYRNFQLDRASGSDGDLPALRDGRTSRKRDSVMHMRKSALLRRFWNKELERNPSTEAIYTPHASGNYLARNWSPTRGRLRHNSSLYNIHRETFCSTSDLNENPASKSFDFHNAETLSGRTEPNNNQRSGFNIHIKTTINTAGTDSIFTPSVSETYPFDGTTNMSSTLESNQNRMLSSDIVTDPSSWAENNSIMTTTMTPDYPRSFVTTAKSPLSTDGTEHSNATDSAYSNSNQVTSGTPLSVNEESSSSPRTVCDSVNNNQTSDYIIKSQSVTPRVSDLNKNTMPDTELKQSDVNFSNKLTVLSNVQMYQNKSEIDPKLQQTNTKDSSSQTHLNNSIPNVDHKQFPNRNENAKEQSTLNSSVDVSMLDNSIKKVPEMNTSPKKCSEDRCKERLPNENYNSSLLSEYDHSNNTNMSSVLTGSTYKRVEETNEMLIPRYSAIPRTSSMEVGVSSGDCATEESECGSLVDSLDDPNSPRPNSDFDRPLSGRSIHSPKVEKFAQQQTVNETFGVSKTISRNTNLNQTIIQNSEVTYFNNMSSEVKEEPVVTVHSSKHDRKLARGEIKPSTPRQQNTEKSPERKGSAFFVSIEKDKEPTAIEDVEIVKQVVVSDHMPKKLKERIQKRQNLIEKHKNVRKKKYYHLKNPNSNVNPKSIHESIDRNGNETFRITGKTDIRNTKTDMTDKNRNRRRDFQLKTKVVNGKSGKRERWIKDIETLETFRIDSHGNMQLVNKDNNWGRKPNTTTTHNSNMFQKQSQVPKNNSQFNKKLNPVSNYAGNKSVYQNSSKFTPNKSLRSVTISEGNTNRGFEYANTSSLKFPNDQESYNPNPIPRRIYQKTEFNDGGRKIEILEIVECVQNGNNRNGEPLKNKQPQSTSTQFKSKIPVPINTTPKTNYEPETEPVILLTETYDPEKSNTEENFITKEKVCYVHVPSKEDLEKKPFHITKAVYSSIEDIDEDPTIDRLIAGILIGNLHNPESIRSPFHCSREVQMQPVKPPQVNVIADKEVAAVPRHTGHYRSQRFESIPEERSLSMESSNEDQPKQSSFDEDSMNEPEYIDASAEEVFAEQENAHRMIQTVMSQFGNFQRTSIESGTDTRDLYWDGDTSSDLAKIKFVNFKDLQTLSQPGPSTNPYVEQCTQTGNNETLSKETRPGQDEDLRDTSAVLSLSQNNPEDNKVFKSTATLVFKQKSFLPLIGADINDVSKLKFESSNEVFNINPKEFVSNVTEPVPASSRSLDKETNTNGDQEIEHVVEKSIDKSIQTCDMKSSKADVQTGRSFRQIEEGRPVKNIEEELFESLSNVSKISHKRVIHTQTDSSFINSSATQKLIDNERETQQSSEAQEKHRTQETQTSANNSPKQCPSKYKTCANQTDFDLDVESISECKLKETGILSADDKNLKTIPKGWTSFYLLKNTQTPTNENSLDTGQYNKLTETAITTERGKENYRNVNQIIANGNGRKNGSKKKDKSSSVENLPTLVTNKTSIEETVQLRLLPQGERKKSVVATKSMETNVLQQTKKPPASTYTESSESETCSSDTEKSKLVYPPLIGSANGAKKQRKSSSQKSKSHKNRQKKDGRATSNDSWSVTVTGTSTYGQGGPDLKMRLRFPHHSQHRVHRRQKSDPGLGDEYTLRHQALPSTQDDLGNESFSVMRNASRAIPHQPSNIPREQHTRKKFQYLPDVNKSQSTAKPFKVFRNAR